MAVKITRTLLCDYHLWRDGEEHEADITTPTINLGNEGPLVLDLCSDAAEEMFMPLWQCLDAEGRNEDGTRPKRKPGRKSNKAKPRPVEPVHAVPDDDGHEHHCPTCGKGFATAQGVGTHRHRKHGYRKDDHTDEQAAS